MHNGHIHLRTRIHPPHPKHTEVGGRWWWGPVGLYGGTMVSPRPQGACRMASSTTNMHTPPTHVTDPLTPTHPAPPCGVHSTTLGWVGGSGWGHMGVRASFHSCSDLCVPRDIHQGLHDRSQVHNGHIHLHTPHTHRTHVAHRGRWWWGLVGGYDVVFVGFWCSETPRSPPCLPSHPLWITPAIHGVISAQPWLGLSRLTSTQWCARGAHDHAA